MLNSSFAQLPLHAHSPTPLRSAVAVTLASAASAALTRHPEDRNALKGAVTAFMLFCDERRAQA